MSARLCCCLLLSGTAGVPQRAEAQFVYQENFTGSTAAGWEFSQGNTTPGPRLTAAAVPASTDPEFGAPAIDNAGNGWLRLATTTNEQSNTAVFDTSFAAQGAAITIGFDFAFWKPSGSPADGITAFLWDASQPFNPGGFGGSLGYANRTSVDGLGGGYVGAGLDVFGNFSNPTESRNGGTGQRPGQVAVRGPGSGQTGYEFLGGTNSNGIDSLEDTFGAGFRMDFPNSPTRPDQDALDFRRFELHLDANDNLTVRMQSGFSGTMTDLFTVALPGVRPDQLRFGFAGSTGGLNEVYEIRNLEIRVDGGVNAFYWDNAGAGTGWATAVNWNQDVVPTAHSYVYLTDRFPGTTSAQTVNVNVSPNLNSMTFSGATPYGLSGTGGITFDTNGSGASYLNVLNSPHGNANHSVANNLTLANALAVQNLTPTTLTLGGNINTTGSGHELALVTAEGGNIVSSGDISGSGAVRVNGSGTTVFSSANTYTGLTDVLGGTLRIEDNIALGSAAGNTLVSAGANLALAGGITTPSGQAVSLTGSGIGQTGALLSADGTNTWAGPVNLTGNATIGALSTSTLNIDGVINTDNANGYNVTLYADPAATVRINGNITDPWWSGAELIKTGAGLAILNANTSYTGDTTIQAGTLRADVPSALGQDWAGEVFVESGGTLALGGGGFTLANKEITIAGPGASGQAALWGAGGDHTYTTQLTLGADASIGVANLGDVLQINQALAGNDHALTIQGSGTVRFQNNLTDVSAVTIHSGELHTTSWNPIGDDVPVVVEAAGTWRLNNGDTIGSLAGAGNVILNGATADLTVGQNNASTTFAGTISGGGDLIKVGTGTMTFTGSNTLDTLLRVSNGTVKLGADDVFHDNMQLRLNGGTFANDGFADTLGVLTLENSSSLDFLGQPGGYLTFDNMNRSLGTLTIDNWIGSLSGNGDTRLQVTASNLSGFGAGPGNLNNIAFTGWGDAELIDLGGGLFEVVPQLSGFRRWDGTGSGNNWTTNGNWVSNGPNPNGAGARAYFGDDPSNVAQTVVLNQNRTVGTMVINATGNRNYTFTGSGAATAIRELRFDATSGDASLNVLGGGEHFIGQTTGGYTDVYALDNLNVINNSSGDIGLTIGSEAGLDWFRTEGNTVRFSGAGTTVVNSQMRDGGNVVMGGSGVLRLMNNTNDFSGGTTLDSGTLQVGADGALGSGALNINGGSIQAFGGNRTLANNLALNGNFSISGNHNLTFQGGSNQDISWSGERVITIQNVTATLGATRRLQGSGALRLDGNGTLEFRGGNQIFSGGLAVDGGTVSVGNSASRINNTMRFGGGNAGQSYLGTGDITVNDGGTLEIWKSGNGNLDFRNGVTLANQGGSILIDSTGASADLTIGDPGGNSPAHFTQDAGTATFNIARDALLGRNSSLEVSGGNMTLNLGNDFLSQGTSGNAATLNVSGSGNLDINLENGADSLFSLGQHDQLTSSGPDATLAVTTTTVASGEANLNGNVTLSDSGVLSFTNTDVNLNATAILNGGTTGDSGTLLIRDGDLTVNTAAAIANAPNLTFEVDAAGSQVIRGAAADSNLENLGVLEVRGGGEVLIDASINNVQANQILLTEGTLILGDDDQIANNTGMTFAGGTWNTDGFSEVLGTLTLTAESSIDLGNGASVIQFANSSSIAWDEDSTLYIDNWAGDFEIGNGADQVRISGAGLTNAQRAQVVFRNPAGLSPGLYEAVWIGDELVPVPEPGTLLGGAFLFLFILFRLWKRETGLKRRQDAIDQQR